MYMYTYIKIKNQKSINIILFNKEINYIQIIIIFIKLNVIYNPVFVLYVN